MNEKSIEKSALWADRIRDYRQSGLPQKEWCQKHQLSISTICYWLRRIRQEENETVPEAEPVFARLPSEQEICSGVTNGHSPVTIYLSESIRIEISLDCSPELLASLIGTLKAYA